jgi:hypothetical protein
VALKKSKSKKKPAAGKKSKAKALADKAISSGKTPEWSLTIPAHTSTYAYLGRNEGLTAPFPDAKSVKLITLKYWNNAGDPSNLTGPRSLALRLDEYFTQQLFVAYEDKVNFPKAIEGLLEITIDGSKTVLDLALRADELYDFCGEQS